MAADPIRWGLDHIRSRYGGPAAAYRAWRSRDPHWYGRGAVLLPGASLCMNDTEKAEEVYGEKGDG